MENSLILERVKKSVDLLQDNTWTVEDLYNSLLQIIAEAIEHEKAHKEILEKILYDLDELQTNQQLFWSGRKDKLSVCKNLEKALILKKTKLLNQGYSIMRFKLQTIQPKLL